MRSAALARVGERLFEQALSDFKVGMKKFNIVGFFGEMNMERSALKARAVINCPAERVGVIVNELEQLTEAGLRCFISSLISEARHVRISRDEYKRCLLVEGK